MGEVKPRLRDSERVVGDIHLRLAHESAHKHVSGEAIYVDDMREPEGTLHVCPVLGGVAHGRIRRLDTGEAARAPGVVAVLSAKDIPGVNDFGHAQRGDDRVFAGDLIEYEGQIVCAVVAETLPAARRAAKLVRIDCEELEPVLNVHQALARNSLLAPPVSLKRGDARAAIDRAPQRLKGHLETGAQDHFYLEGQIALAVPKEDGDIHLYSGTQDPTAVQHLVARILGRPANALTVEVRRMGGAFGGKETQATLFAAIAALAAAKTGRPVKFRADRDDDMRITGKRHEFVTDYEVGFDEQGRILGLEMILLMRCGNSEDQSLAILERALCHCDNCYYLENASFTAYPCKTHTVSACAVRGFGSPQAMAAIERVIDAIAFALGRDPLEVRKLNFYGKGERNITPFEAEVKDNILDELVAELEASSDYAARRQAIRAFNRESPILKKGIAFVPIKYGVGFGTLLFEQAGALIHIYMDGSIHLNHGGTEMGQGLFLKVAQIVAHELMVDIGRIRVSSTATDKVPNTTATAASSGTDLNGRAAQIAARKLRERLARFASGHFQVPEEQVIFRPNRVLVGNREIAFDELIAAAYNERVALSATGYYKTPETDFDPKKIRGQAHRYYAFGAAVAEVTIDTLTGEHKLTRVDILHDVGHSLNPAIDLGQLEGGFIQGVGWLTSEEVYWDERGQLQTHAPSTYKIPVCSDRPEDFRMKLAEWSCNDQESVHRSKAIGEPPLNLAVSVLSALTDAVAGACGYKGLPRLNAPVTPERVLLAIEELRARTS
jgi:xanthine dehydrogenase large subunit